MKKINIAYFGSSNFSADFLEKLLTDTLIKHLIEVKFVVTQPDRPVGRKQVLTPTPVKLIASKNKIPVFENIKSQNSKFKTTSQNSKSNTRILDFSCGFDICNLNFDLGLVYAYGQIIPQELLSLPKYGFWCLHPSLLPKYRGTSPMATALINGDRETGMTIIKMDEEIDHGPIITQEKCRILPTDKRPDLEKKLTELGFQMFRSVILSERSESKDLSKIKPIPQNHKEATYTKKLSKQDGFIEFEKLKIKNLDLNKNLKLKIYNLYRGLFPWPGIWTILPNGKRLKITSLKLSNLKTLELISVQLEGKKEVDFETFRKAYE